MGAHRQYRSHRDQRRISDYSGCLEAWPISTYLLRMNWGAFWVAVDAFVIWYLLKPEVKAAFQPRPMASAASA